MMKNGRKLPAVEKLRRFYSQFNSDDRVLILINADPDAIASAMAVKRLLWRKVQNVTIGHINVINRPDNLAMVNLIGASLRHIKDIDTSRVNRFVRVDSQPAHNQEFQKYPISVVIDHHPDTTSGVPFQDIRPNYGATASIMTEYLKSAKIKPAAKLATALILGIKTDTSDFEQQTTIEDVRAFQFMFRHANKHLIRKIEQSELRAEYLKYFKKALENRKTRKGKVFVMLGPVINPDVCVIIADFFLKVISVKWSIVAGIHQKKMIIIFRNDGLRKSAGKVAEKGFAALGSAGGHRSMARAEISIAALDGIVDLKDEKKTLNWIIQRVEKKNIIQSTGIKQQ